MLDSAPAIGTINTSDAHKRQLARQSMRANLQDKVFCELFGDLIEDWEKANPRGLEEANEQVECRPEQPASRDANGLSGLIMPLLLLLAVCAISLPPKSARGLARQDAPSASRHGISRHHTCRWWLAGCTHSSRSHPLPEQISSGRQLQAAGSTNSSMHGGAASHAGMCLCSRLLSLQKCF